MDEFVVRGGNPLYGEIAVGGAKNVALKIPVVALLTSEEVVIRNVPLIRDLFFMLEVLRSLGVQVQQNGHVIRLKNKQTATSTVPLEVGARLRSSSLVLGPLLTRCGEANIPNPGGCRIGARPIDRHVQALRQMGATITYNSNDGYFHAKAKKLHGATIVFPKNTHTGTETLILAGVLAQGRTVLENAAAEVEIDDLISALNQMGAKIERVAPRLIIIDGVEKLKGVDYTIMPDRNEEVTFALLAAIVGGEIIVKHSQRQFLSAFFAAFTQSGAEYKAIDRDTTSYRAGKQLQATQIVTAPYPGFMTDWQSPWAVFMTQASGQSTIHETVFEGRFSYVKQLQKMGAKIDFFDPQIKNPKEFYNFNWEDRNSVNHQVITIYGPTKLHNAVLTIDDLRAGATLLLAALSAEGVSYVHGVEQIDRGYEKIEEKLRSLGADIIRRKEDRV